MSLPPLIKETESNEAEWKRKVRDLLNLTVRRTLGQGVSAERPKNPVIGQPFYDITLAKPIWWSPSNDWRDASGTVV
ncbi:hypothetical protein [Sphingomonas sp.]|uniref:hypothetical protein n=1 Tax=Sphingomonas sp. TaxID=28214 RepID=UPI003B3A8AE4